MSVLASIRRVTVPNFQKSKDYSKTKVYKSPLSPTYHLCQPTHQKKPETLIYGLSFVESSCFTQKNGKRVRVLWNLVRPMEKKYFGKKSGKRHGRPYLILSCRRNAEFSGFFKLLLFTKCPQTHPIWQARVCSKDQRISANFFLVINEFINFFPADFKFACRKVR